MCVLYSVCVGVCSVRSGRRIEGTSSDLPRSVASGLDAIHKCLPCPSAVSAYPPVCLPTRLCHWILTSATCRCRAGAVGRPPDPVGETIAIGWWIRRRHAVEHGRKPRSCSTAVPLLLLLQITRCQAGWKAGRQARQRRNEAGRDPLDAAIFSPREYVSRVFGFVLSRLMGTIYCRLDRA